jgi:hypothetical protein
MRLKPGEMMNEIIDGTKLRFNNDHLFALHKSFILISSF